VSEERRFRRPSQLAQVVGSVLVALAIAAVAIAVVTAHFGSTPVAEIEAREERVDARADRQKAREDAREEREKAREDAREEREGNSGGPG
jgi:hypothetical protein